MPKKVLHEPIKEEHEQVAVLLTFPASFSEKQVQAIFDSCDLPHYTRLQQMIFDPHIGDVVIYQP